MGSYGSGKGRGRHGTRAHGVAVGPELSRATMFVFYSKPFPVASVAPISADLTTH